MYVHIYLLFFQTTNWLSMSTPGDRRWGATVSFRRNVPKRTQRTRSSIEIWDRRKDTSKTPGRGHARARRFRATLFLRTTCVRSCILRRVVGLAVYIIKTQKFKLKWWHAAQWHIKIFVAVRLRWRESKKRFMMILRPLKCLVSET